MLKSLTHSLWKVFFFLTLLTGCGHANCTNRRCLAEMLVKKEYLSQPQSENCTQKIIVSLIEYETLSVDTKNLRILSQLQASLVWEDPELNWNMSVYPFDMVTLPVDKVWTPELYVTNGITTTMTHSSRDLLVHSNGTVEHSVMIKAEVNCEVNLFNYPFASDECPVAIQTWANEGCGTELVFNEVRLIDGSHGDWTTDKVNLQRVRRDRNYILVSLSLTVTNPFITLLLPSMLIILTDIVSFALPLGGGERNSFKVTLVLSFTMFLFILNNQLPGEGQCSPVIRIHFCVCLILLVVSMLFSIVVTRLAAEGRLLFCCYSKNTANKDRKEDEDEEVKADMSVNQLTGSEDNSQLLRKVVNFLEALDAKTLESDRNQMFADKVDKTFFWFYFICGTIYFIAMTSVMAKYTCTVDHLNFWSDI